MDSPRLVMVWLPGRDMTLWERLCVTRADSLFDNVTMINSTDGYGIPTCYDTAPERRSDWIRIVELCASRTLYMDCDMYLNKVPYLGQRWACERNGGRPHHAIMWSGDYPEIAQETLTRSQKHAHAHGALRSVLRAPCNRDKWEYIPGRYFQHKGGLNGRRAAKD